MKSDVVVLAWPEQAAEVDRLRELRIPRLLLVPADVDPPRDIDQLADWVRVPASEQEVVARVMALIRRADDIGVVEEPDPPSVDVHGRVVYQDDWIALSPTEARLAQLLCNRFMEVVSERELLEHGWSHQDESVVPPKPSALRVHLTRLRQRIAVLGLEVVSVRKKGVVLQPLSVGGSGGTGR